MSRRVAREFVVHILFANEYQNKEADQLLSERFNTDSFSSFADEYSLYESFPDNSQHKYIKDACKGVIEKSQELDEYITKYSVGWNINRISRIAKVILKLSMYEIKYMKIPMKASVNEAVELAKQYDSDESATFLNGILGSFVKGELDS